MGCRGVVFDGGDDQTLNIISSDDRPPLRSIFPSNSSFLGSRTMVSFGSSGTKSRFFDREDSGEEYLDEYFNQAEKKRRLSVDQVEFLERSFETENKLEPERKVQLAKELGLQPRQVAIWFQNRRARWRTKQLETDYETLHASYMSLKTSYDDLLKENENLKAKVLHLKHNGSARATEKANLQLRDAKELSEAMSKEAAPDVIPEDNETKGSAEFKNNEHGSFKSNDTNGIHSSCCVFEADQSGLMQSGEETLKEGLLHSGYIFPMMEDANCHLAANSVGYGFLAEDFGFWSY